MAALELAVCSPALFCLLLGIVECSRLGMVSQLLVNASREGARVAVLQSTAASDRSLSAVDADPGTNGAFIMPSNGSATAGDTPITVVNRVSFAQVSWTAPFCLKTARVTGSATLNSERT